MPTNRKLAQTSAESNSAVEPAHVITVQLDCATRDDQLTQRYSRKNAFYVTTRKAVIAKLILFRLN
jgi:hypothetical protein